jgi:hypothetical protein
VQCIYSENGSAGIKKILRKKNLTSTYSGSGVSFGGQNWYLGRKFLTAQKIMDQYLQIRWGDLAPMGVKKACAVAKIQQLFVYIAPPTGYKKNIFSPPVTCV